MLSDSVGLYTGYLPLYKHHLPLLQVVEELVKVGGADVEQRCRWTHMTALQYAAFFDVPLVLELLLEHNKGVAKESYWEHN